MAGVDIGIGISQGLEKAMSNLLNIKMAREKLDMEKENHATDMKIKQLQLQKYEADLDPEMVSLAKDKLKIEKNAADFKFKLAYNTIGKLHKVAENDVAGQQQVARQFAMENAIAGGKAIPESYFKAPEPTYSEKASIDLKKQAQEEKIKNQAKLEYNRLEAEQKRKLGYSGSEPGWAQEQKVNSVRYGLERGKVVIGKEFGDSRVIDIKDKETALNTLSELNLDPNEFQNELSRYDEIPMVNPKGKESKILKKDVPEALKQGYSLKESATEGKYKVGDPVNYKGENYIVSGFDENGNVKLRKK